IVLNGCHRSRDIEFIPFEINDPVFLFMSTADVAHGHFTVMISSPAAFLNFEKRFLRDVGCHVTVIASYPESGSRSFRFKSFYSHFLLELFVSVKINRITAGKRDDRFLKTGCASRSEERRVGKECRAWG